MRSRDVFEFPCEKFPCFGVFVAQIEALGRGHVFAGHGTLEKLVERCPGVFELGNVGQLVNRAGRLSLGGRVIRLCFARPSLQDRTVRMSAECL